jgi:hypothetical protein
MAVTPFRLNLTRDQLASFLGDHEQIKQFEKLFQIVDTINTVTLDDVSVSAGNAGASANEALSQVEALQSLVQLLAYAPESASQSDIDALQDQITALQQQPPPKEYRSPRYGSFYDTTTQTAAAINTAYAMTFNTTDLSFGVTRGSPTSRIYVDRPNVYNIQFSAQLDKTSGGTGLVWIWLRKNGVDVPDSTGFVRLQGNSAELLAAWNYLTQLNAGDYIELMWEVDDTSVQILYEAATAVHPATPSVILTVSDNISAMEV